MQTPHVTEITNRRTLPNQHRYATLAKAQSAPKPWTPHPVHALKYGANRTWRDKLPSL